MVDWYDPAQLAQTAQEVLVSTIFGRHSDHRLMEALVAGKKPCFDLSKDEAGNEFGDLWLDYVADTGDGWDSTYTVAFHVAAEQLAVQGVDHPLPRGAAMVFGGDEVYPTPSRDEYQNRLVLPYETALLRTDPPHPKVFAIPGNHDWYDSLVSFSRLFCSSRRPWFAGWRAEQERSYFALKLPQGWWLLGTDVQLGSDLDAAQVAFFEDVVTKMESGDRVILCNAEPHWVYTQMYGGYAGSGYDNSNLQFLENTVFGKAADRDVKVRVFIAGDQHHYRRYEAKDGTQKITAGGGGAFLHPTHLGRTALGSADLDSLTDGGFKLRQSFPSQAESRRLCWKNLGPRAFGLKFRLVPAAGYALAASTLLWSFFLLAGVILFTDTHSKRYRVLAGGLHGIAHLVAARLLYLGGASLAHLLNPPWELVSRTIEYAVVGIGGALIGPFILGLYLLISLNLFGRHWNEAFSTLQIGDWRNFLRLHVRPDGKLEIYPIGIRRVARRWQSKHVPAAKPEDEWNTQIPDDPWATGPELIEKPVVVSR